MRTSEIPLFEGTVPPEATAIFFMPQVSGDEKLRRVPKSFFGGEQGPPGEDGTNGTNGLPGTDGVDGSDGTNGTNGSNGTNGTNGAAGAPGAVWRTGSGAPANGLGVNGDFYLDVDTGDVYEKAAGVYSIVANIKGPQFTHTTLTYAATTDIDFTLADYRSLTLAGNVTFTTSNRAAPRARTIRIIGDGSSRTLTFPAGWIFLGAAAPTALAANKIAILSVTCFGANDSDVVAAYSAQI